MRESSDINTANLFINENLAHYNFSLLKMLKSERTKRRDENSPSYETVYTFEGTVYVKINRGDPNDQAVPVRSRTAFQALLGKLDAATSSRP